MNIKHILIFIVFFLFTKSGTAQTAQTPKFNSVQERETWVKAHPQASNDSAAVVTAGTTSGTKTAQSGTASGFPVYADTGNKEKDDAAYAAAKKEWIAKHPDEYAKMTGKPN